MIRIVLAVLLAAVSAQPALAQGDVFDDGRRAINRGDIDGAIGLFTNIIDGGRMGQDGQAMAYSFRGFAYLMKAEGATGEAAKKDYEQAIADAGNAIQRAPDDIRAHFVRGSAFSFTGKYEEAIKDLDIMIGLDPGMPEAYVARGFAYNGKAQYDKAIENFDQAIERRPFYAVPYKLRAIAYSFQGRFDKAIGDYNEAVRLNPADTEAYFDRAVAYSNKGEMDKAIADFDIVTKAQPRNALAFNYRGRVREGAGQYEQALGDFDAAIAINPRDAEAHYFRAAAYSGLAEYDKAIGDLDEAIKIKPGLYYAYYARGRNNFYAGRYAAAAADIERSLSIMGGDSYRAIWLHLAEARAGKSDMDGLARNAAKPDMTAWPGPLVTYFLGKTSTEEVTAAAAQGDNPKTRTLKDCQASFYLGEGALLRGDPAAAATQFGAARESCPRYFVEYEGAVAELKRMGK